MAMETSKIPKDSQREPNIDSVVLAVYLQIFV